MSIDRSQLMKHFLDFSVVVTGFSKFNLQGTDQVAAYYATIEKVVGDEILAELLRTFHRLAEQATGNQLIMDRGMRTDIFGSEKLGPIARNIIQLWYVATWYQLPQSWRDNFGVKENDVTFVVSPQAYPEGLLWPAIGVNPPAAKAPGYGTWSSPPVITLR